MSTDGTFVSGSDLFPNEVPVEGGNDRQLVKNRVLKISDEMRIKLEVLADHYGSRIQLCRALGFADSVVSNWLNGHHGMSGRCLVRVNELFSQVCPLPGGEDAGDRGLDELRKKYHKWREDRKLESESDVEKPVEKPLLAADKAKKRMVEYCNRYPESFRLLLDERCERVVGIRFLGE